MNFYTVSKIFNLVEPRNKILHLTWVAFFLTFAIWFGHAPLLSYLKASLGLSDQQLKTLLIVNVAFTIPARILVGMLVDIFGPRIVYTLLLLLGGSLSIAFACSTSYTQLTLFRFLLGFIGAGFVVGIRLVAEWFPAHEMGMAEGIYGGWGNFGAAAAAIILPLLSVMFGGENGWRWALISLGLVTCLYSLVFFILVRDTPEERPFIRPVTKFGMEVCSWRDLYLLLLMNIPMYLALGLLSWKLSPRGVGLITEPSLYCLWVGLTLLFILQTYQLYRLNAKRLHQGVSEVDQYEFKQVSILGWCYFVTFGSELAVVSMLPLFFMETFTQLNPVIASLLASTFAFMNLIARPAGGILSDRLGRNFVLRLFIGGLCVGYLLMSWVNASWWVPAVVALCMSCSFCVQAGCGAVFAMVPLIRRQITGQVAGMTGAYGNVGGVFYLTLLSFVSYQSFFLYISASAIIIFGICFALKSQAVYPHQFGDNEPVTVAG